MVSRSPEWQLEWPLASDQWVVPAVRSVEIRDMHLVWQHVDFRAVPRQDGVLEGFLRVADAPAEAVIAYAERYGFLGLCSHKLPATHNPRCLPVGWRQGCYREPLDAWRDWSNCFRGLLNIASRLHENRVALPKDWEHVFRTELVTACDLPRSVSVQRIVFAEAVNRALVLAGVRPKLTWSAGHDAELTLSGGGLFGGLAIQLMIAVSRTEGLALCSGCGVPYVPERRPTPGRRRYCKDCRGRRVPQRDAQRDYEQRRGAAERVRRRGRQGEKK